MACQGCAEAQEHAAKAAQPDPHREHYARGYRDGADEVLRAVAARAPRMTLPPWIIPLVEGLALGLVAYATLRLARRHVLTAAGAA